MGYIRRLSPGGFIEGYPTDAHNFFYDACVKVNRMTGGQQGTGASASVRELTCIVWNETGAAIDVDFPVLKLSRPVFTPEDNDQAIYRGLEFEGTTPDAADNSFAIVRGPIADATTGGRAAVLMGPTYVDVYFEAGDESKNFAALRVGDNTQLKASSSGAPIIWKGDVPEAEYLPATVRCAVLLGVRSGGSTDLLFGALTSSADAATGWGIDDAGIGMFRQIDDDGSFIGEEVEVKNRYFDTIPAGAPVWVSGDYIVNAGCNTFTLPEEST